MDEIEIVINPDRLTFGVMRRIEAAKTVSQMADVLNEIVDGGVDHLPVRVLPQIVERIKEQFQFDPNLGGG